MALYQCRACILPQCGLWPVCLIPLIQSSKIWLTNITFRATEALLVSLIPACFSPLLPPQHPPLLIDSILARTNNRLDTRKNCLLLLLLLAHMEVAQIWQWREGAVEACCRAEGQGLIPSRLASFQPRGTSVLLQRKSLGLVPPYHQPLHPPLRMIDALSALYSREKALDICIIDWGWEKRGDGEKDRSRETDCVGVCLHLSETLGIECVF